MQRLGVLVLLVVVACLPAWAQGQGATDNELYAAYCKGVADGLDQGNAQVQQMSRRFSGYLFATGALTDPQRRNAVLGIGAATVRGRADQQQCTAMFGTCNDKIFGKPGTPVPRGNSAQQFLACMDRNPSCSRAMRCTAPDVLPF